MKLKPFYIPFSELPKEVEILIDGDVPLTDLIKSLKGQLSYNWLHEDLDPEALDIQVIDIDEEKVKVRICYLI